MKKEYKVIGIVAVIIVGIIIIAGIIKTVDTSSEVEPNDTLYSTRRMLTNLVTHEVSFF